MWNIHFGFIYSVFTSMLYTLPCRQLIASVADFKIRAVWLVEEWVSLPNNHQSCSSNRCEGGKPTELIPWWNLKKKWRNTDSGLQLFSALLNPVMKLSLQMGVLSSSVMMTLLLYMWHSPPKQKEQKRT